MEWLHLFDAHLQYETGMATAVSSEGREGDLIGSGSGTLSGGKLTGTIRWSMYAADCAYLLIRAGMRADPQQHLCKTNPGGVIETEDGARIMFDAKGYGLRGPDPSRPHLWQLTAALHFATEDERYRWLNTTLGV